MNATLDQEIVDFSRDQGERFLNVERRFRGGLNERDIVEISECFALFRGDLEENGASPQREALGVTCRSDSRSIFVPTRRKTDW